MTGFFLTNLKIKRTIIRKFREGSACTFELARSLDELNLRVTPLLNQMIRKGIIVNTGFRTFYLDEQAVMKNRMSLTKWGMVILMIILGGIMFYFKTK